MRLEGADRDAGIDAVDGFVDDRFRQIALDHLAQQQYDIRVIVGDQHLEFARRTGNATNSGFLAHVGDAERLAKRIQIFGTHAEVTAWQCIGLQMAMDDPAINRRATNVAALGNFTEAEVFVLAHVTHWIRGAVAGRRSLKRRDQRNVGKLRSLTFAPWVATSTQLGQMSQGMKWCIFARNGTACTNVSFRRQISSASTPNR